MKPWIDLTGQIALVTGAAAGIGRATARGLAELGATVVLLDRDGAAAEAAAQAIRSEGGKAEARPLDARSRAP